MLSAEDLYALWVATVDFGKEPQDVEVKLRTTKPLLPNQSYALGIVSADGSRETIELAVEEEPNG